MHGLFSSVESVAKRYGLSLNKDKTVLLRLFASTAPPLTKVLFADGSPVRESTASVYLRVTIANDARQGKALSVRLGKASTELDKLKTVWNSPPTDALKLQIFHIIFGPMILYSASELSHAATQVKRLDAWYMRHLRRSKE